jgi:hypothetical protein
MIDQFLAELVVFFVFFVFSNVFCKQHKQRKHSQGLLFYNNIVYNIYIYHGILRSIYICVWIILVTYCIKTICKLS